MKTDDLIDMLAAGAAPVPRRATSHRLAVALVAGLPVSLAIMLLLYGVRPDLAIVMRWPMFWMRLLFPVCMAIAGFVIVHRLARPGVRVGGAWLWLAAPVVVVWTLAAMVFVAAPEAQRPAMIWGQTWRTCALNIALISVPVFVGALAALKGLAPTRPALAGAAAGAMAGAAGAAVYALHCPEMAAPFLAIWYVAGIALPVVVGALIGRLYLRW